MKKYTAHLLAMMAVGGVAAPAWAQVRFADLNDTSSEKSGISFREANEKSDLKNGTLITLKLRDGTQVSGHVVYLDAKANRLFVRSKPGETPVGYAEGDITKLGKGVRIRTAGVENVVEPEIHKQTIYNGSLRSVTYFSIGLSPREKETLERLQNAENALAALAYQKETHEGALSLESAAQVENLKTQRLLNLTLWNENVLLLPSRMPIVGALGPTGTTTGGATLSPGGLLEKYPPVDLQVWRKGVEEIQQLRSNFVYEDGQIVAVLPKS
jgi:hypothetical protein